MPLSVQCKIQVSDSDGTSNIYNGSDAWVHPDTKITTVYLPKSDLNPKSVVLPHDEQASLLHDTLDKAIITVDCDYAFPSSQCNIMATTPVSVLP